MWWSMLVIALLYLKVKFVLHNYNLRHVAIAQIHVTVRSFLLLFFRLVSFDASHCAPKNLIAVERNHKAMA